MLRKSGELADLEAVAQSWFEVGLIKICGKDAASVQAVIDACKAVAGNTGVVRLQDFVINTD